jgi:hypothetical protein
MNQIAANHVDNGVRIRWKIVPAVTDVCRLQVVHIHRDLAVRQPPSLAQAGHKPVRPPKPFQVCQARRVVRKPCQHFLKRPWVINTTDGMSRNWL